MILNKLRGLAWSFLGAAFLAACSASAQTVTPPVAQITKPVDASVRHIIADSVPVQVRSASDLGRASAALPMKDMLLRLKPSAAQVTALNKFVADVQNPSSPNFHKWITPAEFGSRFGVSDADAKTVATWLTSNGFTVSQVANGKGWIRFSGTSSQVESAFATEIHSYSAAGAKQYANAKPISIPDALSPAVAGLLSANSFTKRPLHSPVANIKRGSDGKMLRTAAALSSADTPAVAAVGGDKNVAQPNFTSQESPEVTFLAPGDFSRIYNTKPLIAAGTDGTGVSIAIVGRSDISLSDVEAFRTVFGLPYNDPNFILANGDPGVIPGDDEEAILDVEWSGAVAPKAKINYVIGASTYSTDGVDISASYIVDNVVSPIMSVSFGACEQSQSQSEIDFYNNLWEQAAAEGISVFVSAGDSGSSACDDVPYEYIATPYSLGVSALASTPFNTAVGGTEFADTSTNTYWNTSVNSDLSSVKGYIPETVWNEACNPYLPVSATNCFYDPNTYGTYAGAGGASNCSVHPDGDTKSLFTGLFDCQSGYPKPAWQTGPGVPQDGARDIPDVSLAAAGGHDGYMICYDGSCQWTTNPDGSISLNSAAIIGGTSASSPSMAGIMALVEQKNGQYQGLANYQLYKLANLQASNSCDSSTETDPTQASSCVFNDITAGSNALFCDFGNPDCTTQVGDDGYGLLSGWSATPGYDLASGLGSVNAANLVSAWGSTALVATASTLTVSSTKFAHGTPVNVASVVSPTTGSGTPSGDVLLKATGTSIATPDIPETLVNGQYAGSLTNLPGGTYNLTAQYVGDATYATSTSAPVSLTVTPEDSVMTPQTLAPSRFLILGKHPIVPATGIGLGTNWYISISVAGNSGGGIPTGSIAINDGTKTIGTYPLDSTGSIYIICGPYTECDYPLGTINFTATYSGDSSFNKSTSTFPFTINQGSIEFEVLLSSLTPPAGSTVVAQVYFNNDPVVLPTGNVSLYRDDTGALITTGTIGADGIANIPFVAAAGDYHVTGTYPGDNNYKAGTLFGYDELITSAGGAITTSTTLSVNSTTSVIGGKTQAVIVVTPSKTTASATIPSGTVTVHTADGLQVAPVNLVGGQATAFLSWGADNIGVEKIYATYDGDANFNGSSTAIIPITVNKATATLQLSALSGYVAAGGQTSVTAAIVSTPTTLAAAPPTGTVQFFDTVGTAAAVPLGNPQPINGGNGGSLIATLAPVLASGIHSITAVYSGDVNWNTATSTAVTIDATTPDFSVVATPNPLSVIAGQSAAVDVTSQSVLGFTGPVALSCGTLPVGLTCNTATVAAGASGTITITSTAPGTVTHAQNSMAAPALGATGAGALAALLMLVMPKRRRRVQLLLVVFAAGIAASLSGCGGNGSPKSTALALTSSSTKVASGSAVTLEATISSSDNVTGTVTFSDNGTAIGSPATVSGGVATLSTSTLSVGTHSITATYSGDNKNLSSQSADTLNQTITGTFNLTLNATSGTLSHALTVPATLQ